MKYGKLLVYSIVIIFFINVFLAVNKALAFNETKYIIAEQTIIKDNKDSQVMINENNNSETNSILLDYYPDIKEYVEQNNVSEFLLNAVLKSSNIKSDTKLITVKTLHNYHKRLDKRADAFEIAHFTGGTIIIPIITMSFVGIKELFLLPANINAKIKLKKVGLKSVLHNYNTYCYYYTFEELEIK